MSRNLGMAPRQPLTGRRQAEPYHMPTRFQRRRALMTEKGDMVDLATSREMAFRYPDPAADE